MNNQERWKKIPGWPLYSVSSLGRVRNDKFGGRLLCLSTEHGGYLSVELHDGTGGSRRTKVHRLVALAFHGEPAPGQCVRHLDGDPSSNTPENLRYGTPTENAADRDLHGRTVRGEAHHKAKATVEEVALLRLKFSSHMAERESRGFQRARRGFVRSLAEGSVLSYSSVQKLLYRSTW